MKRCPKCDRLYEDDSQRYCLEDGDLLILEARSRSSDPQPTLRVPHESANRPQLAPTIPTPEPQPRPLQVSRINRGRVLLGGLVTGLVLNVGELLLNSQVVSNQLEQLFRRCGLPLPGPSLVVIGVVSTFVLGILIVLSYAAIRPRLGPGPRTAIVTALFAWAGVYVYQNVIAFGLGIVPPNMLILLIFWGLVEYVLATLAGAALYKEV